MCELPRVPIWRQDSPHRSRLLRKASTAPVPTVTLATAFPTDAPLLWPDSTAARSLLRLLVRLGHRLAWLFIAGGNMSFIGIRRKLATVKPDRNLFPKAVIPILLATKCVHIRDGIPLVMRASTECRS